MEVLFYFWVCFFVRLCTIVDDSCFVSDVWIFTCWNLFILFAARFGVPSLAAHYNVEEVYELLYESLLFFR